MTSKPVFKAIIAAFIFFNKNFEKSITFKQFWLRILLMFLKASSKVHMKFRI